MTLTNEEIVEMLTEMDKESKAIKEELLKVCWYMRGSISYDESMYLSFADREMISKLIEKNLDTTKDTGLPFF